MCRHVEWNSKVFGVVIHVGNFLRGVMTEALPELFCWILHLGRVHFVLVIGCFVIVSSNSAGIILLNLYNRHLKQIWDNTRYCLQQIKVTKPPIQQFLFILLSNHNYDYDRNQSYSVFTLKLVNTCVIKIFRQVQTTALCAFISCLPLQSIF